MKKNISKGRIIFTRIKKTIKYKIKKKTHHQVEIYIIIHRFCNLYTN